MDWTSRQSLRAQTLAANILVAFLPTSGRYAYLCPRSLISRNAPTEGLAWQFARQILVPLPREGGVIDADFLDEWLKIHLRILHDYRCNSDSQSTRNLPRRAWLTPMEVLED
jgi:hypothetical protein